MEFAVKRFARNVLLLHLVLLAVVLALVLLASRAIRQGARDQAQQQAESRQRMLASQTGRGIEAYYQSILSTMLVSRDDENIEERKQLFGGGWLSQSVIRRTPPRVEGNPATHPAFALPSTQPAGNRPGGPPPNYGGRGGGGGQRPPRPGLMLGQVFGRQLDERVTHLFEVTRTAQPPPPKGKPAKPMTLEVGEVTHQPTPGTGVSPEQLAAHFEDWLRDVKEPAISSFQLIDGNGYNLVALPIPSRDGKTSNVLVAAVPVATVTEHYLAVLNNDPGTTALMLNDGLTVMAGSRPELVGTRVSPEQDAAFNNMLVAAKASEFRGSTRVEQPFHIGPAAFAPALLTAEPIEIAGRRWVVVVGSPLAEVDAVGSVMFDRIFVWAVFVVAAITAILLSTAVQLIRSRIKLEKTRVAALRKELDRAREIQQAWLPRESPACATVDVAAVNFPANHISGDFYNWFDLPDGRVAVAIGDVTGHGMSAAFLMATTQLLVRTTMQRVSDPAAALASVNRQLCTLIFNGQFVTLQILVIDPCSRTMELASAGHPPPLLSDGGEISSVDSDSGLVLGVDEDATYDTYPVEVPPGATLLLYTDGAADVQSPRGARLGTDGLRKICPIRPADAEERFGDAKKVVDAVVAGVNHFRGGRELGDDLTLVAVQLGQTTAAPRPELVGAA